MVLTLRDITHDYGTGPVLHDVSFTVQPGRVHALLGMNGAGKSTLVHLATGLFSPTAGHIEIDGAEVRFRHPGHARDAGVVLLAQEVDRSLVGQLAVHENLTIATRERRAARRWGFSPRRDQQQARELLAHYDIDIDVTRPVAGLSLFEKQVLCLVRAVASEARYLLLDEPTSSFDTAEVQRFYRIVRAVLADGLGVVFISHRLNEVMELADEVTVLRDGHTILAAPIGEVTGEDLAGAITGNRLTGDPRSQRHTSPLVEPSPPPVERPEGVETAPETHSDPSPWTFELPDLRIGRNRTPVDLHLRAGEVLVVFGPLGSGKTTLARTVFALAGPYTAIIDGTPTRIRTPQQATRHGIALVPEERRRHGIWLDESVQTHLALGLRGLIHPRREKRRAERLIPTFDIQPAEPERLARRLSGGNQQKVAFAKWGEEPQRVLVLDEPMTGVDVGAKEQLFQRIEAAADAGTAVLYLTSEPDDALRIADRILQLTSTGEAVEHDAQGLTGVDLMLDHTFTKDHD